MCVESQTQKMFALRYSFNLRVQVIRVASFPAFASSKIGGSESTLDAMSSRGDFASRLVHHKSI